MVSISPVSAVRPVHETTVKQSPAQADTRQGGGADEYIPSERSPEAVDYATKLQAEQEWGPRFDALRDYVLGVLQEQGVDTESLAGSRAEAVAAVADDGYWGAEQTADRIFEFAIAQAADDPGRLQKIRDAIDKGYQQAREAFGGWLPEVSEHTIERVHERLDAWEQDLAAEADDS